MNGVGLFLAVLFFIVWVVAYISLWIFAINLNDKVNYISYRVENLFLSMDKKEAEDLLKEARLDIMEDNLKNLGAYVLSKTKSTILRR